jgi:hypothetical protein
MKHDRTTLGRNAFDTGKYERAGRAQTASILSKQRLSSISAEAEQLVSAHWDSIQRVAAALLHRGVLDASPVVCSTEGSLQTADSLVIPIRSLQITLN